MSDLAAELQRLLQGSILLGNVAEEYVSVNTGLTDVANESKSVFEDGKLASTWHDLIYALCNYCADSQDNMNDTSRTLIRYINAVCEADGQNAKDLKEEVEGYNGAVDGTSDDNDTYGTKEEDDEPLDGGKLPEPDTDNDDQVYDEPEYDDAARPK